LLAAKLSVSLTQNALKSQTDHRIAGNEELPGGLLQDNYNKPSGK